MKLRDGKVTRPTQPQKGRNAKTGAIERVAQRQQQAMSLRLAGCSYRVISEQLGVTKQQAFRDVGNVLSETLTLRNKQGENLRELELKRCDALLLAVWKKASLGDAEAVRAALKIMERRAKLLGLDAQVAAKLEVTAPLGEAAYVRPFEALSDEELSRRLGEVAQLLTLAQANAPSFPEPEPPRLLGELTAEQRYEAELERRKANGHAH